MAQAQVDVPQAPFPIKCGMAVATCYSGFAQNDPTFGIDFTGFVVAVVDVRDPANNGAVLGANWAAKMYHGPAGQPWTAQNLGQVFGVTLDDAVPPNIFVASTYVYGGPPVLPPGTPFPHNYPKGPGAIYRLDGVSGAISLFATLPNAGPSLGNLCFDPVHQQFFVSNLEDGLIYRLGLDGAIHGTFDHGDSARPKEGLAVLLDDGVMGQMTAFGRRVLGLKVYKEHLYYSVWNYDWQNPSANVANEIWSVALAASGAPVPGSAQREISLPRWFNTDAATGTPGYGTLTDYSSPVSDISFAEPGRMLLSERSRDWFAHRSRTLEYTRNLSGQWVDSGKNFYAGFPNFVPDSAAGGNDFDCNGDVWVTADLLLGTRNFGDAIYGLSHISGAGNTMANMISGSYLVDLNGEFGTQDKTQIGDVAVYCCAPVPEAGGCRVTGGSNHEINTSQEGCITTPLPTHISHGGQVGAPFSVGTAFTPNSPCISGEWQHNRHLNGNNLVGTFHAAGNGNVHQFDSLLCACLPCPENPGALGVVNGLCNPGDKICGPEPRHAPANKIAFSGVGDYTFSNGVKTVPAVFRVDIEDRSEGNSQANSPPPDRYRMRIWLLDPSCDRNPNPAAPANMALRNAVSANPATIAILATTEFLPAATAPPDIDDGGDMTQGNHQIHPATGAQCGASTPTPAARIDTVAEIARQTPGGVGAFGTVAQGYQGTQDPAFVYRITITNSGTVTLTNLSVAETTGTVEEDTSRLYFAPGATLPAGGWVTRYRTNTLDVDTVSTVIVAANSGQDGAPLTAASTAMASVISAVTQPRLSIQAARLNGQVQFSLQTEAGVTSQVEYTESLSPPRWTMLQTIVGDGSVVTVTDAITNAPQRFYRVRVE